MKKILILFLIAFITACSNKSELDCIVEKNSDLEVFVDSLKNTAPFYKKCEECTLSGLDGNTLIGITDRYPPHGNFDKKEIEIGVFDYDTFLILNSETDEIASGEMYVCYFNQEQREKFADFSPYYANRIGHHKQLFHAKYVNNTVVIIIENQV